MSKYKGQCYNLESPARPKQVWIERNGQTIAASKHAVGAIPRHIKEEHAPVKKH